MFKSWIASSSQMELAKEKAEQLKMIYANHGYGLDSNVIKDSESYKIGIFGELTFQEDYLHKSYVSFAYLNNELNEDATPDNGDFIIDGKLANLKTQTYRKGIPDETWNVNVNLKDYEDDLIKGIETYHFLFFNPTTMRVSYAGYLDYKDVPVYGQLIYKDEPLKSGRNVSETMYSIPCLCLRTLIPDTCLNKYPF